MSGSGLSDVYQRRLIGFTIESRDFTFRAVRGSKECRTAEENNCCVEESGESGSSGSESTGGSESPVGTVSVPCCNTLLPEILYYTYNSITYEIYYDSITHCWTATPVIEGIGYFLTFCCRFIDTVWTVGIANDNAPGGSQTETDATPDECGIIDYTFIFSSGAFSGITVRVTSFIP